MIWICVKCGATLWNGIICANYVMEHIKCIINDNVCDRFYSIFRRFIFLFFFCMHLDALCRPHGFRSSTRTGKKLNEKQKKISHCRCGCEFCCSLPRSRSFVLSDRPYTTHWPWEILHAIVRVYAQQQQQQRNHSISTAHTPHSTNHRCDGGGQCIYRVR